jgi:anaerobic glycerol-3-phosphate dehydrogenase
MNIAQAALELTGGQGLDKSLDYKVNAAVPVSAVGSGATEILGKIPGGSKIREIKVTGLITGAPTKPTVTLGVADMAANVAETAKETVKEQVKETVKENVEKQAASFLDAFKKK